MDSFSGFGATYDSLPAYSAQPSKPASSNAQMDYYPPMDYFESLQLFQVSSNVQTFSTAQGNLSAANYSIKLRNSTNFLNRPDLCIAREQDQISTKVGEGRFGKYDAGTTVKYLESGTIQNLQLEDYQSQRFAVTIDGIPCLWWQPSKVSRLRMEIVTPSNRLMAQFTYTSEDTFIAKNIKDSTVLGTLEVAEAASQQCVLDQVVCTTVVLIERAKRRGQNLRKSDIMVPTTGLGATAIG